MTGGTFARLTTSRNRSLVGNGKKGVGKGLITSETSETVLKTVTGIAVAFQDISDCDHLLTFIAKEMVEHLRASDCAVYLLSPSREFLTQKAAFYAPSPSGQKHVHDEKVALGRGVVGVVGATGVSSLINDPSKEPQYNGSAGPDRSVVCVPLMLDGHLIGVIECGALGLNRFPSADLHFLESVAAIGAMRIGALLALKNDRDKSRALYQANKELKQQALDRQQAEHALRTRQARLTDFAEAANDWTWEQDADFRFTQVNAHRNVPFLDNDEDVIGLTRWEVYGASPDQNEHWKKHVEDLRAHRTFRNFENPFVDKTGKEWVTTSSGVPFYSEDGAFAGYRGTVADVTELVRSKQKNEQFLTAIDHVSEGFALWGKDESLVMHNARMSELSGLPKEVLKRGLTFEGWVRSRLASGMIPEVGGDAEAWIQQRLAFFRRPEGTPFEVFRNGRWYRLQYIKLDDGSTVQTINDIQDYKSTQYRFELACSLAGVGVFEWDTEAKSGGWSESMVRLFRAQPDEYDPTLKVLFSRVSDEDKGFVRGALNQALDTGVAFSLECRFVRKDGSVFWGHWQGQLIGEFGANRWFGTLLDIDEQKAADKLKGEFTSTISHEIRTPLTSIKGSLDLVLSGVFGDLPEKAEELLQIGRRNSDRLLILVNDLLDVEKVAAGNIDFNMEQIPVAELLRDAHDLNLSYAGDLGINLVLSGQPESAIVNADKVRIQQVFANLISNAVKFSSPGADVEIWATLKGDFCEFSIRDYGTGIPNDFLPRLYDRFAQADGSDVRKVAGTGLGLSISKSLVEHQGGTLDCTTQEGVGTTFFFTLPIATQSAT